VARGYSYADWQSLSTDQRTQVYQERERLARSMAAINISTPTIMSSNEDNNHNSVHAGQIRGVEQASLDNVSQVMSRRRTTSAYYTVKHTAVTISALQQNQQPKDNATCRAELDTHADTCGVNNVAHILSYTGKMAHVSAFSPAAVAYYNAITGETYVLILNQAHYFGTSLPHIILNPNQLRANSIVVNDIPKHLSEGKSSHSIDFKEENIKLPLLLKGVVSYLPVRTPTQEEIDSCTTLVATAENIEWEPYSEEFEANERVYNISDMVSSRQLNSMPTEYPEIADTIDAKLNFSSLTTEQKKLYVSPEELAKRWAVGKNLAEATVKATTQSFIRANLHPIDRRYRTKNLSLKYNTLHYRFTSDTFFSSTPSILRNTCAQLFMSDFGFGKICPQRLKSEAGASLQEFLQDVGIPRHLHTDNAKEMTLGTWARVCKDAGIKTTTTEAHSPWQNRTEVEIRELKRHVRRLMERTNSPRPLWDFCSMYIMDLRNRLVRPLSQLQGRTPYELLTGNTPDISEFLEYEWYQPVWYYDLAPFPQQRKRIARWIGIAHRIGQAMCYWLLPESGIPIARTSIQAITQDELATHTIQAQLQSYDAQIANVILRNDTEPGQAAAIFKLYREDEYMDESDEDLPIEPILRTSEADMYDQLLLAEPVLDTAEGPTRAKIIGRKRDANDNLVGQYNHNPILNTRVYLAQFPDGSISEYAANVIAEAIYDQTNDEGHEDSLFSSIIGHEFNHVALYTEEDIAPEDRLSQVDLIPSITPSCIKSTKGWKICVEWLDGTSSWHPMVEIKNCFPVQLAEYAIQHQLQDNSAFNWWVKHTLHKKQRIIAHVHSRYSRRTHKFGIQVPNSPEEALLIDRMTNTTFWYDAMQKECKNVKVALNFLDPGAKPPIAHKWIKCHMIFDVKWISLERLDM
jgi:hypothetical protein